MLFVSYLFHITAVSISYSYCTEFLCQFSYHKDCAIHAKCPSLCLFVCTVFKEKQQFSILNWVFSVSIFSFQNSLVSVCYFSSRNKSFFFDLCWTQAVPLKKKKKKKKNVAWVSVSMLEEMPKEYGFNLQTRRR